MYSYMEYKYDEKKSLIDSIRHTITKEEARRLFPDKIILSNNSELEELYKEIWKITDKFSMEYCVYIWNIFEMCGLLNNPIKNWKFLINNYFLSEERLIVTPFGLYIFLYIFNDYSSSRKKEYFDYFLSYISKRKISLEEIFFFFQGLIDEKENLDIFDFSILDILEGKIIDEKTINWGVGQIMKLYPKKYDASFIKDKIKNRWNIQ